tara:strand:- start:360 stop:527 length:168 start_codon:yes stop_codon:yes gene_type:complete
MTKGGNIVRAISIIIKLFHEIDETSKKRLEKLLHNEPSSDFGIELIESYTIKSEE